MARQLIKGNEAIGAAAIRAGCRLFFGYPITPQNEIPEYMSRKLPEVGGCFVQAESEVAAINMVYGAAGAGARVMTSSSSPGIALKQEGLSYLAGAELPCVVVNMMRSGPGLGGILPSQADYFQATRGGGNGDYYMPVYAPANIQETVDIVYKAFEVADLYRTPVMILGDGLIGQMMEPVEFPEPPEGAPVAKSWATTGTGGCRKPNIVHSLRIEASEMEAYLNRMAEKWQEIARNECMWEETALADADVVAVAYGTSSRIVQSAIKLCAAEGISLGLIRPITLWPFPVEVFNRVVGKKILVVEMSMGQMLDDVKIAVEGRSRIAFCGRSGGAIPQPEEIFVAVKELMGGAE